MSDPRRLLSDPAATPFERDLLESWSEEQPSTEARARALAIAGAAAGVVAVTAGMTATAAAASTSSTVGAGAGAGTLAPKAAALGVGALTKWIVVGGLVVVGGAAGTVAVQRSASSTASSTPRAMATSTVPGRGEPSATTTATSNVMPARELAPTPAGSVAPTEPPTMSPSDLPAVPSLPAVPNVTAGSSAVPAAPHGRAATAHNDENLAAEIGLFERARAALDGGDVDRGITLLDDYERRFPAGAFTQEAEVLRVQALLRKGNRPAAIRAGERFLAAHPTSPHATRVRAMLAPSTP